jgi:predicted HicB family RNase H-like nuclease
MFKITLMNEKSVRKLRNVKINPDTLHKARVEALRARRSLGEWPEKAIDEKIEREQKKVK